MVERRRVDRSIQRGVDFGIAQGMPVRFNGRQHVESRVFKFKRNRTAPVTEVNRIHVFIQVLTLVMMLERWRMSRGSRDAVHVIRVATFYFDLDG